MVLSELSLTLLVHDGDRSNKDEKTKEKKERGEEGGKEAEEINEENSSSQILALINDSLLPRLVWFFLCIDSVSDAFSVTPWYAVASGGILSPLFCASFNVL